MPRLHMALFAYYVDSRHKLRYTKAKIKEVFALTELTSLNIKVNRDLKKQADTLFNEMGMTLTTAVNIFIRQAVLEQAIPFRIYVDSDRAIALKAKEAMKAMQEQAAANGMDKMSMEEIDAIILQTRREKPKKRGA